MRKLATFTFIAAFVAAMGMAGPSMADPYADAVANDGINNSSCGGNCAGVAADTLEITNDTFASLGDGGSVTLNFTDNTCWTDDGPDVKMVEIGGQEDFTLDIGLIGGALSGAPVGSNGSPSLDMSSTGIVYFNQAKITDVAQAQGTTGVNAGYDPDSIECLNSMNFGVANISKQIIGDDDITETSKHGFDGQQTFVFTIEVTNPDDVADGLIFKDTVPAEFDITGVVVGGSCENVSNVEVKKGGKNGHGGQKLAPDKIEFEVGQGTCTLTVTVETDDDHPGNGPNFTPTTCDGTLQLNSGVHVFDDEGSLIFVDDSDLFLICGGEPPV